jgi:hypothetical protein
MQEPCSWVVGDCGVIEKGIFSRKKNWISQKRNVVLPPLIGYTSRRGGLSFGISVGENISFGINSLDKVEINIVGC